MTRWFALVDHEVVGPFDTADAWYHDHAGPDWRARRIIDGHPDPWRVARTDVDEGCISTVFLGLDHNWWPDQPPLLFETMLLPTADLLGRCSTWRDALALHHRAVEQCRANIN